jgi:hypothetical protein
MFSFSILFIYLGSTGVWTQGLMLARLDISRTDTVIVMLEPLCQPFVFNLRFLLTLACGRYTYIFSSVSILSIELIIILDEVAFCVIFFFFYRFIIHMCIQGLGQFSPLPPLPCLSYFDNRFCSLPVHIMCCDYISHITQLFAFPFMFSLFGFLFTQPLLGVLWLTCAPDSPPLCPSHS